MQVLITGGAGYIGSHTNELFNSQGIQTIVLDDLSNGHKAAVLAGKFIQGNFGDQQLVDQIMEEQKITAVIHFGALASVPDSVINPAAYYRDNVTNMQNLLDCCVKHQVKYFVFSSSASVYGEPQYSPIDEDHPHLPINPYGRTKLIGEQLLADYAKAYGIRFCAFRYFCAAGDAKHGLIGEAHNPETHLIPVMIKAALAQKPFKVFGNDYPTKDGSCIRDFIHVLDLADAHLKGLHYIMENECCEYFNLGSETGFTVLEMIQALQRVTGKPVPYLIASRRPGDPAALVASSQKAKQLLGWQCQHSSIEEILQDALRWEQQRRY